MTTSLNLTKIKEELTVFLRNSDIFTISQRGVTTVTEELDGNGSATDFNLAQSTVRNVRTVTVGGAAQTFGTDYTVAYGTTTTVTFTTPPGAGTDNVDITYDYGTTDKIFPDFPRTDLKISSFPRIAVDIIGMDTSELGLGATSNLSNISFSIYVYGGGTSTIDGYIATIRNKFIANKKNFFYLDFLTISAMGPMLVFIDGKQKIYQRNVDLISIYNIEEV